MIKVSVFYPSGEGKTFDMDYYCNKHIPFVQQLIGDTCKKAEVEQGLSGMAPRSQPVYLAIGHLLFDSVGDFTAAFTYHGQAIVADVPNFTNSQPVLQVNQVKMR